MPDAPEGEEIPEVTEIDELQTFIGNKKNKVWVWTRAHPRPVPSANPEGSGLRSRLWRFAPPWSDATGATHPARQGVLPEGLCIAAIAVVRVFRLFGQLSDFGIVSGTLPMDGRFTQDLLNQKTI